MKMTNTSESKEYRMRFTATGSAVETMDFIKSKFRAQMLTRAVQLAVEAYFNPAHKNPLFEALGVTQTAPTAKQPKTKSVVAKTITDSAPQPARACIPGAITLDVDEMFREQPAQAVPVVKPKRPSKKLTEGISLNVDQMFNC